MRVPRAHMRTPPFHLMCVHVSSAAVARRRAIHLPPPPPGGSTVAHAVRPTGRAGGRWRLACGDTVLHGGEGASSQVFVPGFSERLRVSGARHAVQQRGAVGGGAVPDAPEQSPPPRPCQLAPVAHRRRRLPAAVLHGAPPRRRRRHRWEVEPEPAVWRWTARRIRRLGGGIPPHGGGAVALPCEASPPGAESRRPARQVAGAAAHRRHDAARRHPTGHGVVGAAAAQSLHLTAQPAQRRQPVLRRPAAGPAGQLPGGGGRGSTAAQPVRPPRPRPAGVDAAGGARRHAAQTVEAARVGTEPARPLRRQGERGGGDGGGGRDGGRGRGGRRGRGRVRARHPAAVRVEREPVATECERRGLHAAGRRHAALHRPHQAQGAPDREPHAKSQRGGLDERRRQRKWATRVLALSACLPPRYGRATHGHGRARANSPLTTARGPPACRVDNSPGADVASPLCHPPPGLSPRGGGVRTGDGLFLHGRSCLEKRAPHLCLLAPTFCMHGASFRGSDLGIRLVAGYAVFWPCAWRTDRDVIGAIALMLWLRADHHLSRR